MEVPKINNDAVVKTAIMVILPIVVTIIVFYIYRRYYFGNEFINKTLLRKDMMFKYFTFDEFDSRKGEGDKGSTYYRNGYWYLTDSGKNHMNVDTINRLDEARHDIQINWNSQNPTRKIVFAINSGNRSDLRNAEVGGKTNSAHRDKGDGSHAVDIAWRNYDSEQKEAIEKALRNAGFNRIGKAAGFIHADNDSTLPNPATWSY